ncbi:unnamed protein product, partial [marine sediment metagenome]
MAKLTKTQKVGAGLGIFGLITAVVAAIRAKAAPPVGEFEVTNLIISPPEVYVGEPVEIS